MSIRAVKRIVQATPTIEGAGVKLRRGFGFGDTKDFDPFLLFDDFRNDRPADYRRGFPWHPHRGIETITYVLSGTVEHADSLGNKGALGAGDVQWMTAGSGIMHQEMPQGDAQGRMHGFQLWANLPSSLKMTRPRYQDIGAGDIPPRALYVIDKANNVLTVARYLIDRTTELVWDVIELVIDSDGFMKVREAPTGFMCVKRRVLDQMVVDFGTPAFAGAIVGMPAN